MRAPSRAVAPVERVIRLGPVVVKYVLRRSARSRGIRATIDPGRGLVVSLPSLRRSAREDEAAVEAFLAARSDWVLRHLERLERERAASMELTQAGLVHYRGEPHRVRVVRGTRSGPTSVERVGADTEDELVVRLRPGERRSVRRLLVDWLRARAAEAIDEAIEDHAPGLGVRPSKVDLRDPRSRWGSAARNGRLMFSWRLVLAPPGSLETVVVHELAHLRVFGHGSRFWAIVAARRPSHRADRAWLRRHSHVLHSTLADFLEPEAAVG